MGPILPFASECDIRKVTEVYPSLLTGASYVLYPVQCITFSDYFFASLEMLMKSILVFGDSNVRGFVPGSYNPDNFMGERLTRFKRWTGVLQKNLGPSYDVIEEGLNGRTTVYDEIIPGRSFRNSLQSLSLCLESHYPLDLVIFMLGTNDLKKQFDASPQSITEGMRQLVKTVQVSAMGPLLNSPKIIVIAPPLIVSHPTLWEDFDNTASEKSKTLIHLYKQMTLEEQCGFIDSNHVVKASNLDGLHLDENYSEKLGKFVSDHVISFL